MYLRRQRCAPAKREKARQFRKNLGPWEDALWQQLRRKSLGVRFHRQHLIAGYIVDFWCPAAKLVVELDGAVHNSPDQKAHDRKRDKYMTEIGITVLRYPNQTPVETILASLRAQIAEAIYPRKGIPSSCQQILRPTGNLNELPAKSPKRNGERLTSQSGSTHYAERANLECRQAGPGATPETEQTNEPIPEVKQAMRIFARAKRMNPSETNREERQRVLDEQARELQAEVKESDGG